MLPIKMPETRILKVRKDTHLPFQCNVKVYFVDFKGKKTREVFEPLLRIFYRIDSEVYWKLMESLICEIESELEETGYHLRNGRLDDYGFPDLEGALEIYRFVNPDSLVSEERSPEVRGQREIERGSSIFYLTFQNEGPFLSSILSNIDDSQEQDRLRQKITTLCNKAIVAETIDLSNIIGMERVIKKVYHTLNLGGRLPSPQFILPLWQTKFSKGLFNSRPLSKPS